MALFFCSPTSGPPTAAFSADLTNGASPLTVTFSDQSSGGITNRFWDLGDGSFFDTNSTSFSHIYTSPGTFTVSLAVNGADGSNSLTRSNYVVATSASLPTVSITATDGT